MRTVLISRAPLSDDETKLLSETTAKLGFEVALSPTFAADERLASLASTDDPDGWRRLSH